MLEFLVPLRSLSLVPTSFYSVTRPRFATTYPQCECNENREVELNIGLIRRSKLDEAKLAYRSGLLNKPW
jgi:hypothetical protein